MSNDEGFQLNHMGETNYEYEHRDGSTVKVVIRELQNGANVGAYHYSDTGDKLNYHRFRINSVDDRKLVAENFDDSSPINDAVAHALHSGGWELLNLHQTQIDPPQGAPLAVQFLNVRDGFQGHADSSNSGIIDLLFTSLARAVEIGLVIDMTFEMAENAGHDADEYWEEAKDEKDPNGHSTIRDHVEGWFINAVRPETQRSTENHDAIVEAAEKARNAYRQGADFPETFDRLYDGNES